MIEIIYDEAEQSRESPEIPIRLPKNLRQIGEGFSDTAIYIEDYVMTFIRKLWEKEDAVTVGVLLGEVKRSGKETYIFISGAICVDNSQLCFEGGQIIFTDDTWSNIYSTIKQFFNRHMIVGWFVNRNETCRETGQGITKTHLDNFPGADKILFLSDTAEKEEKVYRYESGILNEQSAYYIYYERNEDMQEYMLAGKKTEGFVISEAEVKDDVPASFRNILKEKKEENTQKRLVGVLYGACTFLAFVILMIGVAMMNNYDKIESLERLVSDLYKTAMGRIDQEVQKKEEDIPVIDKVEGNIEPTFPVGEETKQEESEQQENTTEASLEETDVLEEDITNPEPDIPKDMENEIENIVTDLTDDKTSDANTDVQEGIMYHIVKEGDTLTSISRKFYNTDTMVDAIRELNDIKNINIIYPGQVIKLP